MKKPLTKAPASLQRLLLKLQGYNLKLVHKPGRHMYIADTLSRAYISHSDPNQNNDSDEYKVLSVLSVSETKLSELKTESAKDKTCQNLIRLINNGWPQHSRDVHRDVRSYFSFRDELIVENGIIFKGYRVVIPKSMRKKICYNYMVHMKAIDATKRRAHETVSWDTINIDINNYVNECSTCQSYKPYQQREKLTSFLVPNISIAKSSHGPISVAW